MCEKTPAEEWYFMQKSRSSKSITWLLHKWNYGWIWVKIHTSTMKNFVYNFTRNFFNKLQDLLQETTSFVLKTENFQNLQL